MRAYAIQLVLLVSFSSLSSLDAATIAFSSAQTINDDADITTTGTLVYGYTYGASVTVNGQAFTTTNSFTAIGSDLTMTFTGSSSNAFDPTSGTPDPYNSISANYKSLLQGGAFAGPNATVSFNNLTIGQDYQFQFWINDSRGTGNPNSNGRGESISNVGGFGAVALDYNTTNAAGGLGQFVIGTFTADATTQAFELAGFRETGSTATSASAQMSAIQLRAVPEPSHLALLGLASITAILRRRRH